MLSHEVVGAISSLAVGSSIHLRLVEAAESLGPKKALLADMA